jgi:GH18 family chitinase
MTLAASALAAEPSPLAVVGYLPDYRLDAFQAADAAGLTELVYFSAEVGDFGALKLNRLDARRLEKLRGIQKERKLALTLCVGGWGRSAKFAELAADSESRGLFAMTLTGSCLQHGFQGVDLDWEHPQGASQVRDHGLLLSEIHKTFEPKGLKLSIAVAGWQGLDPLAIESVDAINLMAYDNNGPQATLEFARADVKRLLDRGVPPAKIRLGVPFYGRGVKDRARTMSYGEIARKFKLAPETDEVDGLAFNGPTTLARKVNLARELGLGGIMIWEVGQDARGEASLLRGIRAEVERSR